MEKINIEMAIEMLEELGKVVVGDDYKELQAELSLRGIVTKFVSTDKDYLVGVNWKKDIQDEAKSEKMKKCTHFFKPSQLETVAMLLQPYETESDFIRQAIDGEIKKRKGAAE